MISSYAARLRQSADGELPSCAAASRSRQSATAGGTDVLA